MNSSLSIPRSAILALVLFLTAQALCSQNSTSASIPAYTISPNGRYGVTVPHFDFEKSDTQNDSNDLVDLKTSRTLTKIPQEVCAYDRALNHHDSATPVWSADSSLLLWRVNGKWFPDSYILLRLNDGTIAWQLDLLKTAQNEILRRTRKAVPKLYNKAKISNAGNGSAYPEGFTIDVEAKEPLSLPLRIKVNLTANPKDIPDKPNLDSHMEAVIDPKGNFQVTDFALDDGPSPHF